MTTIIQVLEKDEDNGLKFNIGSGAIPSDALYRAGVPFDENGWIYASDGATVVSHQNGFPYDSEGRLAVTTTESFSYHSDGGVPFSANGRVVVTSMANQDIYTFGAAASSAGGLCEGGVPLNLFLDGAEGALFDLRTASTLNTLSDGSGTVPVIDSDLIGLARDQSGNGNNATQATAGSRPDYVAISGVPYAKGDGTAKYLAGSITSANYENIGGGFWGIIKHNSGTLASTQAGISLGNSGDNFHYLYLQMIVGGYIRLQFRNPSGVATTAYTALGTDAHVFVCYFTPAGDLVMRIDGTAYSTTFTPDTITLDSFGLLALTRTTVIEHGNAAISQPAVFMGAPTANQIANIEQYLNNIAGAY